MVKWEIFDVKFVVIGGGDLIGYYMKLVEDLGLEGNVEFFGWVSRERFISSYKLVKFLVLLLFKSEVFGMVVVEVFVLGIFVIVSRVGEFLVIVDDKKSGFLVRLDEWDIVEKIFFLFEDEKMRRKMVVMGRDRKSVV